MMRTSAALRRAPLLLEQPTDLLHACLMFLDLDEMRATKSVCHAFCKAARCWLNDVRWLGKHISLHRILDIGHDFTSHITTLPVARRYCELTTAQWQELSCEGNDETQHIICRLLAAAVSELLLGVRPWLSRAALARVRACPGEASHRSMVEDENHVPLLPLHQALMLGLGEECMAALATAHPPSPSWRLADLLRARQFGEASAIARLASPEAAKEVQDAVDQRQASWLWSSVTPRQLCEYEPTFLHLASKGSPSAALVRRLLELDPSAPFYQVPCLSHGLPLHIACGIDSAGYYDDSCYPRMPLEALTLLARANPEAVGEAPSQGGVTPLLAAASLFPERVPVLLEVNPGAAAVATEKQGSPFDEEYRFRGMLPLHAACASGNEPATRALLEAYPQGASCVSTTGLLPHHCAARAGRVGVLRLLVAAYPDGLHEEDDYGLLPIDETDVRTVEVATAVW